MSFAGKLERESEQWVQDGLLTAEVRAALLDRYPADARSRLTTIVAGFGAALVFAGIVSLVAVNWQEIDAMLKLVAGVLLLVAAFGAGYVVRFRLGYRKIGEALMLVGSGIFLADLALVSQQYHVEPRPEVLVLIAGLAMAPFSYILGSRAYAFVFPAVLTASLAVTILSSDGWLWFDGNSLRIAVAFVGVGIGIVAIGILHRFTPFQTIASGFEANGLLLTLGALFVLGFVRHTEAGGTFPTRLIVITLVVPIALSVVAAALALLRGPGRGAKRHVALSAVFVAAITLGASAVLALASWRDRDDGSIWWSVAFWVLFLATAACAVAVGFAWRRDWLINLGVVACGIFIVARYFDLISDRGWAGGGFLGAGLLLLGLAFVGERSRRALIAAAEERA